MLTELQSVEVSARALYDRELTSSQLQLWVLTQLQVSQISWTIKLT